MVQCYLKTHQYLKNHKKIIQLLYIKEKVLLKNQKN